MSWSDPDSGTGYTGSANSTGFTQGRYVRIGYTITATRLTYGNKRAGGAGGLTIIEDMTKVTGDDIQTSYGWDEETYSNGFASLFQDSMNKGWGNVSSP